MINFSVRFSQQIKHTSQFNNTLNISYVFDLLGYASFSLGDITTKVANKLNIIVLYFEMLI